MLAFSLHIELFLVFLIIEMVGNFAIIHLKTNCLRVGEKEYVKSFKEYVKNFPIPFLSVIMSKRNQYNEGLLRLCLT